MPGLENVNVELSQRKAKNAGDRRVAQLTIRDRRGVILRAEEKNDTIYGAIDSVINKMYRQIKRHRGRVKDHRRGGSNEMVETIPPDLLVVDDIPTPRIVRRKQFSIQPMSENEALDQMLLLDHDFFVFNNRDDNSVNVLYRRKDGNVGILQPTVD